MTLIDPRRLDLEHLASAAETLSGEWPQAGFRRLLEPPEAVDARSAPRPPVRWSATARPAARAEPGWWLQLQAQTAVRLVCQRCLQGYEQPLAVDRPLRFVRGDALAEQLDADSDDDVLALPPRLDLHELVEDELILALPIVPTHEHCPEPLWTPTPDEPSGAVDAEPADAPPHPFAALAALRKSGSKH